MKSFSDSIATQIATRVGVQRVPSVKATVFQHKHFVSADLAAALVTLIDAGRRPSTIADDNGDAQFRTSETCDLPADAGAVQSIETQLTALSGIDPAYGSGPLATIIQDVLSLTIYFVIVSSIVL